VIEGLDALEALAAPQAGTFLYGDQLSHGRHLPRPPALQRRRFDVPLDAFPTLLRAEAATLALAPVAAAHPDRQESSK
jgi:hypothetical protein